MLVQIRQGVFETNSSSTHSLSIVSADDFNAWKDDQLYLDRYNSVFVTKEDLIAVLISDGTIVESDGDLKDIVSDSDRFQSYSDFLNTNLEIFSQTHTTKSGDVIVAFGEYGYDG